MKGIWKRESYSGMSKGTIGKKYVHFDKREVFEQIFDGYVIYVWSFRQRRKIVNSTSGYDWFQTQSMGQVSILFENTFL